jgi:hypothetical protein
VVLVVVLACVVLIDLASYSTVALRASGTPRMNPLVGKIMTCVIRQAALAAQLLFNAMRGT